jgi:hypothetical protein
LVRQGGDWLIYNSRRLRAYNRPAEVEALLDAHTKSQARTAPLALLVLVTFVVLLFLATARP